LPSGWTGSSTANSITATVGSSSGTITVTPSNACGQGASQTLPVTITPPINTQPSGVLVFSGASTSFSVSASGATGYQWQVSTDKGGSWIDISDGGVYSEAATATLNISNVNGLNGNLYRCSVSTASCGIVLSNSASLTIDVDSDSDGVSDSKDLDDDNDGISDIVELTACNNATLTTGTTLFSENFGTGTITSTIYTNYCYESGSGSCAGSGYNNNLNDGEYSILRESRPFSVDYGAADHGLWISTQDHTVGDTGGRMIVFNAAIAAGEFYRRTITVEPNVPIMVSFWVINLMASGSLTKPNIYVQLQTTDGDIIAATTGEIDQDQAWHEFTFTTYCGNITEAELILTNEATGGDGNDLAIDDILIKIGTDCDTDGDGTPDRVDLDSDDDGCKDVREAGFTDSNNDGKLDGSGVDANGLVAGYSSGYTTPADGNGDGTRDYLKAGTAPTILAQPTNRSICGGTSANFSVSASNANKYQWQVSTNGGSTWSDLSNTGIYSGTTTSTLTLTNATTAYNGFLYQVIVSNTAYACSVLTSDYATLSVNTARPANSGTITGASSVCASSSANVYNASATNATTYTWSVPSGWTINSGQGTESISVTAGASGGTISENASNGCGASITNSTFDVSVISQPTATITGNNSPICAGSTVTFNLTGTSGSTVTYNINGETSSTVTLTGGVATVSIPNTVENKVLTLESVASGICTQILSSSSTVSVNALPTASILGNNGPICSGSTATFTL